MQLSSSNFTELWKNAMWNVLFNGNISAPRGKPIREIIGMQLCLEDARNNIIASPLRKMQYRFMVAEWLWIMAGRSDAATMDRYNPKYREFALDPGCEHYAGAYGPRLFSTSQWFYLIDTLRKDNDTRQAVASIWTPCPAPSRDIPCTVSLQFLLRNGILHAIVVMRSSDLWRGLVYDMFNFTMMLNVMAADLGAGVGSLTYQLGSAHLYETEWDLAEATTENSDARSLACVRSPLLPAFPPADLMLREAVKDECAMLREPWRTYVEVLRAKNNAAALHALSKISEQDYTRSILCGRCKEFVPRNVPDGLHFCFGPKDANGFATLPLEKISIDTMEEKDGSTKSQQA